jgi:hypothetical protein
MRDDITEMTPLAHEGGMQPSVPMGGDAGC